MDVECINSGVKKKELYVYEATATARQQPHHTIGNEKKTTIDYDAEKRRMYSGAAAPSNE